MRAQSHGEPRILRPDVPDLPFGLLNTTSKEEGCEPSLRGIFHNLVVKLLSLPVGMSGQPGPGNGHRTFFGLQASGFRNSWRFDPWLSWRGGAGSPRPRRPPLFSCTYLLLPLHRSVSVSGGVYSPMGWQQYSRPLWLSRGNPYILYLKAMTAQMRAWWTGFPQGHFSRRNNIVRIFAWPESPFWLT